MEAVDALLVDQPRRGNTSLVRDNPAFLIMLLVLAILCLMASTGWLRFAKHPTDDNRDMAARFTGWTFGFVAIMAGFSLLMLAGAE